MRNPINCFQGSLSQTLVHGVCSSAFLWLLGLYGNEDGGVVAALVAAFVESNVRGGTNSPVVLVLENQTQAQILTTANSYAVASTCRQEINL